jgi:hypothetical protein
MLQMRESDAQALIQALTGRGFPERVLFFMLGWGKQGRLPVADR